MRISIIDVVSKFESRKTIGSELRGFFLDYVIICMTTHDSVGVEKNLFAKCSGVIFIVSQSVRCYSSCVNTWV